jgi:cell division septal protein FtsQ
MKKNKIRLPVRLIVAVIISLIAMLLIILQLAKTLKNLNYFKIKTITLSEHKERVTDFSYLENRNIFSIDLLKESRSISGLYPSYKKIKLIRILPNHLFIDFIKRKPIAYIKLFRNFCVDEDLVLFDIAEQIEVKNLFPVSAGPSALPVILGLETKIFGAKSGKKYYIKELETAIDIIKMFNSNRRLRDASIERINALNADGISFYLSGNLEIKIGQENIKDKIDTLSSLLINVKNDLNNIEYIDLRFKEPVIKPKNAK